MRCLHDHTCRCISIHAPLRERPKYPKAPYKCCDFNPRSLAGATGFRHAAAAQAEISIHAPLRERPQRYHAFTKSFSISIHAPLRERLVKTAAKALTTRFQSTLPCGSDSIKTNYFSINLSQAFFANRLNSNTQEFYFDVRKLLVSHSSPGCEPKLNYMFHITSHRIILHYFSSCQSICK